MLDWDRKSRLVGWAGGSAEKAEVSTGQFSGLDKIMILLRKSMVAGAGFEPATFGLWARLAQYSLIYLEVPLIYDIAL